MAISEKPINMPEETKKKTRKNTRNPLGTIRKHDIVKTVVVGGNITKRKITVWDARKRYTNADGVPDQKFRRCATATEANTALVDFKNEIDKEFEKAEQEQIVEIKPARHTFFELCDYFSKKYIVKAVIVDDRQLHGYRQPLSTLRTYVSTFKEFFGDSFLDELTYEKIDDFALHLAVTPIQYKYKSKMPKVSTNNRKLELLRRILNVGVQLDWLPHNPMNKGDSLIEKKNETERDRILTFDEEMRLLAACEGTDTYTYKKKGSDKEVTVTLELNPRRHLKLIIIFLIETGMRTGEMFSTRFEQIDMERKIVFLNAIQTKALKKRYIPISQRMEDSLKLLFSERDFIAQDLIFDGLKRVKRSFETACKRAGITDLTLHDLRHTATSWMSEAGVPSSVRMNIVGHTTEKVHQRYNNVSEDIFASTRGKMNEFRKKLEEKRKAEEEKKKTAA